MAYCMVTIPIPGILDIRMVFVNGKFDGTAMQIPSDQQRLCGGDGICHCPTCKARGGNDARWDTLRYHRGRSWEVHWPDLLDE